MWAIEDKIELDALANEIEHHVMGIDRLGRRSIARIGRRRWWLSGGIIGYGLSQDLRNIGAGFSVPLEPGVHLALGIGAVSRLRTGMYPHREDTRERLCGGLFAINTRPCRQGLS